MISSDIVAAHGPVDHDRVVGGLDATAWHALAEAAGGAAVRIVAAVHAGAVPPVVEIELRRHTKFQITH